MKFDDLDDRMRVFETAHDLCVLPGLYMVARLDGRGFGVEDTRGHMLSLRITQDTIADLSAGSVRKVNAVLRRFERDGLVRKEHGRIVLPDVGALEALALGG